MPPRFAQISAWISPVLFAIGLAVAAMAGLMIASWHSTEPLAPAFERVQYDTAWVFLFCGSTLLLHAIGMRRAARLCAAVPVLLGAVRLIAYLAPGTVPVHPIMANPWLPYRAGEYNDMAILTALVALVTGMALASLSPRTERRPWHAVTLTQLASVALALSLLMLFGASGDSALASVPLPLAGGSRTSAMLFIVISAATLAYAVLGTEAERAVLSRAAPLIVWLAVFACVLVLWRALALQETRFIQHSIALSAAAARGQIERELETRIDIVRRFAQRTLIYGLNVDMMRRDAAFLLDDVEELRSLAWAGPDYVIRWVAPAQLEAAVAGFDARNDPQRRGAVEQAVATRKTTLSKFTNLLIGGQGVVIYTPVFQDDQFKGLVSATLAKGNWLKSLLAGRFPDQHLELIEDGQIELQAGSDEPMATAEWVQELPLSIHNATWSLRVTPTRDYVRHNASELPDAALALGVLMATLLALSTYLFEAARTRARELDRVNVRLTQDIARRQHAEQELRESESRTRLIINAVKDCAIYMLDVDGRIASWNKGAQTLNGYSAEEIIGKHFTILYAADRKQPPESELAVATRRGWYEEECWHLRKDGTRYCADDVISAIRDEQGILRGYAVVTRDATLRIELRAQTERARDFYMSLFAGFPNLVWRSDTEGACDYLNQAWVDYTGRKREAQFGIGWLESVHPDDRPWWREIIDLTFPARNAFEIEFRLRRADGRYGWMICVGRPYHDMAGKFSGYLCSCYDNTVRRAMEDALKESEERYERITANVPGIVFKLRREEDGRLGFRYVSHGCYAVAGLDEATIGADAEAFFGLVAAADRAHLLATLEESAARQTTWTWAGRLRPRHEAVEKWITIRAMPRRDEDGATIWDGVVLDDTQSRLAQLEIERSREELRELSRHLQSVREDEKARIARDVHDELGATLSALKMDLESLGERASNLPEAIEKKRIAMIQLVDGAVVATRRIVTDLRPSILDDLGLAAALRWQASDYRKHTKTRFHLETPEPEVSVDRECALALFRIFQEALTNVARHAQAANVWIQFADTDKAYVLTIGDDGVGIADADLRKPTSHGLRGVRERAQQLGGDVTVSGQPGTGTTLVVSIPKPLLRRVAS
jgi:two-component system, NarL family, sensor histidine kinase UhpB